ncbi:hypothetical protein Ddye_029661 [Dipteronia dyeriana]|uniref:CCHC-type domain-containing protein n=1 Tax=Dipteronia dyeriana TaxID=168575 RepID=A0AAD9TEU2_9ROSI|nr:hypothetical protein Ddye_029661 [Dipteronia dyeriana]
MKFNRAAFWVQILNVPLFCIEKDIGRFLGSMTGEVREIDVGPLGECVEKFIHVRVVIDIEKPLCRILKVDGLRDGKESTMLLRYERLPPHCFYCGRLGHIVRDCLNKDSFLNRDDYELMFGPWL